MILDCLECKERMTVSDEVIDRVKAKQALEGLQFNPNTFVCDDCIVDWELEDVH